MVVETRKPLRQGLNLGVDPAQVNGMVLADGARLETAGVVSGRLGQVPVSLTFPQEHPDGPATVEHDPYILSTSDRPRGMAPFYDQRLFDRAPQHLSDKHFAETTEYWDITNSFTFTGVTNLARYDFAFGTNNGTLSQTVANWDVSFDTTISRRYQIRYSLTNDHPANVSMALNALYTTGPPTSLDGLGLHTTGEHVLMYDIPAGATMTDFTIAITDDGAFSTGSIDFYYFEIKEAANENLGLPQRLNFVYKAEQGLWLNNERKYDLPNDRRAKIITYGNEVYVADPTSKPMTMRWQPDNQQRYLQRIEYDTRKCGINWPLRTEDVPRVQLTGSGTDVETGYYRFRLVLENRQGDYSNPSLTVAIGKTASDFNPKITNFPNLPGELLPDAPDHLAGPDACTYWRVYVSYEPGTENALGVIVPAGDGPTAWRYMTRIAIASATTWELTSDDMAGRNQEELMELERGAPPRLIDMAIINDVAYGIADNDVIPREMPILSGPGRPLHFKTRLRVATSYETSLERQAYDSSEIRDMRVSPEFLFFSPPGEPQYMEHWIRFGKGGEIGVGLGEIGNNPVIFTNVGLLVWDPEEVTLRRIPSDTGCGARDSIQRSGAGLRFMGSDGVPRYFNGATVERVDREVYPIFGKEDYVGDYSRYDSSRHEEVVTASGESTYAMIYPEQGGSQQLMLAHVEAGGEVRYAIDKREFQELMWLGRENRWIVVIDGGYVFAIEEGFIDYYPKSGGGYDENDPGLDWKFRWFGPQSKGITRFKKLKLDIDTKGLDLTVTMNVDKKAVLTKEVTVNKDGRRLYETGIPPEFKGQYLDVRFQGGTDSTKGRPELYDLQVETVGMGVF